MSPQDIKEGSSTNPTAQDFWDAALATWWDEFPGHRFSFDPVAP